MARVRPPDERFTAIGCGLWRWKPFIKLRSDPKVLWLALYTGEQAKKSVPGLYTGSVYSMADDSSLQPTEVHNALGELVERGMVQYDQENRIARLTMLPDTLDRPNGDRTLRGWWTRFRTMPSLPIRDAHVPLLHWLATAEIDRLAGLGKQKAAEDMGRVWNETFQTIDIPKHVPKFLPLSSSDTSTSVQPSLFGSVQSCHSKEINNISGSAGPCQAPALGPGRGPDQDPDQVPVDQEEEEPSRSGPRHLTLVPDPDPPDPAARARESYAAEMQELVRQAGGGHLLGDRK